MDRRERLVLGPVVVLMFWLGLFPGTVLRKMDASVTQYLHTVRQKTEVQDKTAGVSLSSSKHDGSEKGATSHFEGGRE